ncbi:MAG TPA: MFS transporter [Thermoplasmata archaeon]|nr:MFS transporter [Thermoplasmata archaeon]
MARAAGYRQLLRNRRFLLFETSAIAASAGYSIYAISIPLLAYRFSGSLLVVGLVLFAEFGAYTLTFLIAPWVDRARDKRTIFLACFPAQAVAVGLIGVALTTGLLTTGLLLGLVAFVSFLWDFAWAATNVAPRLLLSKDELYRAQGFGGLVGGVTQLGGYATGGALLVLLGPAGGMFLYAAFLGVAATAAAFVSLPTDRLGGRTDYWREFRDGWRFFRRSTPGSLLPLGMVEVARGFFGAAPALMITSIAVVVAAGSTSTYAGLYASWVIGGVAVGVVVGELNPRGRAGRVLAVAALVEAGGFLAAVVFAGAWLHAAYVWFLIGAASTAYLVSESTFIQGATPSGSIGRVSSNLYVFTGVGSSIGAITLGAVVGQWSLLEFGALVAAGFLAIGLSVGLIPSIRSLAF